MARVRARLATAALCSSSTCIRPPHVASSLAISGFHLIGFAPAGSSVFRARPLTPSALPGLSFRRRFASTVRAVGRRAASALRLAAGARAAGRRGVRLLIAFRTCFFSA